MRITRAALWVVWVLGGALTAVHAIDPVRFALRSPWSSVVLETTAGCAGLLLAALSYGRWRQRSLLPDLLTCYALTLLASANVAFSLLPIVATQDATRPAVRGAALVCGVTAALLFAAASLLPERTVAARRAHLDLPLVVLAVVLVAATLAVVASSFTDLFSGLTGAPSAEATGDRGEVAVTVLQLVAATSFMVASLGFARRGRVRADPFRGWLAVAAAFWALARANYAVTPAKAALFLTLGDWLRLAAYLVIVVAAVGELMNYWRRLADMAVLEERRRIARELHDGLAQELAFIASQTTLLVRRNPESQRHLLLRGAAERALDESRRAIAALTQPIDEPLHVALAQTAEEVGGRLGARVHLELSDHVRVNSEARESLLRITREAVTNAVRHGQASSVTVSLANHDGVTLEIADTGRGFDPEDLEHLSGRLGMKSMQERAQAMGAHLEVTSRPYRGTVVRVRLP